MKHTLLIAFLPVLISGCVIDAPVSNDVALPPDIRTERFERFDKCRPERPCELAAGPDDGYLEIAPDSVHGAIYARGQGTVSATLITRGDRMLVHGGQVYELWAGQAYPTDEQTAQWLQDRPESAQGWRTVEIVSHLTVRVLSCPEGCEDLPPPEQGAIARLSYPVTGYHGIVVHGSALQGAYLDFSDNQSGDGQPLCVLQASGDGALLGAFADRVTACQLHVGLQGVGWSYFEWISNYDDEIGSGVLTLTLY